jgi:hypothetical protein
MTLNPDKFEPVRIEYYTSKLFIGQDIRGNDRNYDKRGIGASSTRFSSRRRG